MVVFTGDRLKVFNNKNDYSGVHRWEVEGVLIIKTTMVVFTGERVKVFSNKNDYSGVHR